jgi:hypothetical protein
MDESVYLHICRDSGHSNRREDIADVMEAKKISLEVFRGEYIKKLLHFRRLGSQVREVQMDVVRLTQFLTDPNSSDRLRLESLAATLQLARQALVAEDVVLSRNAYMAKYAELSKSYLYKGLQCLQQLKQRCAESEQLRQELFQQSCSFIKDMMDNQIVLKPKAAAEPLVPSPTIRPFSQTGGNGGTLQGVDGIIRKYEENSQNIVSKLTEDIENWKQINIPESKKIKKKQPLTSTKRTPATPTSPGKNPVLAPAAANDRGNKQTSEASVEHDSRDDVLQDYAAWVVAGQQQFQTQVSQSMSRCIKMTLNALENRFMRISKAGHGDHAVSTAGSKGKSPLKAKDVPDNSGFLWLNLLDYHICYGLYEALELVCDHWTHAKNLMGQIKQREEELSGARNHFEVSLQHVH